MDEFLVDHRVVAGLLIQHMKRTGEKTIPEMLAWLKRSIRGDTTFHEKLLAELIHERKLIGRFMEIQQ